jgi:hypothetical protein
LAPETTSSGPAPASEEPLGELDVEVAVDAPPRDAEVLPVEIDAWPELPTVARLTELWLDWAGALLLDEGEPQAAPRTELAKTTAIREKLDASASFMGEAEKDARSSIAVNPPPKGGSYGAPEMNTPKRAA